MKHKNEISKRLFDFAVDVIELLRKLDHSNELKIIKFQLIKSSSSSGANYEEAQSGISKADFINKVRISLKEKNESIYWLKLLKATIENTDNSNHEIINYLIDEGNQLSRILGSIVNRKNI